MIEQKLNIEALFDSLEETMELSEATNIVKEKVILTFNPDFWSRFFLTDG
ncbi:hypothetical protein [Acinetobacter sp. ANC 4639]